MKDMTVLFLRREQEVLLAMKKRGFGKGRWNGVGGKVELGETPEEAAKRECLEEINVTPQIIKKVAELIFNEMH
jgi:8-oxo-dGTP pyrophosphatase MutT (NUDIX family)